MPSFPMIKTIDYQSNDCFILGHKQTTKEHSGDVKEGFWYILIKKSKIVLIFKYLSATIICSVNFQLIL